MKKILASILKNINFIAVLLISIFIYTYYKTADTDLWSRLLTGKEYLRHGWVLYSDKFSFLPTLHPWVDHEWLCSILFYLTHNITGDTGLLILKLLFVITTITVIYLASYIRKPFQVNIIYFTLILLSIYPSFGSNIRPHLFTFLFFSLWLLILEHSRKYESYKYLFIMPLTMLIWVNTHGGCISGLALIIVYIFSQLITKKTIKPYCITLAACSILILVNPYHVYYLSYLADELLTPHGNINEWTPVNILDIWDSIWFKIMVILTIISYAFSKLDKKDPVAIILLITFTIIGFKITRHSTFFGITAGIFAYEHFNSSISRLNELFKKILSVNLYTTIFLTGSKALTLLLIIILIYYVPSLNLQSWKMTLPEDYYPVQSTKCLKSNHISGNILLPFKWGGYISWMLYPNNLISCDGRYVEVFPYNIFKLNNDFYYARKDWDFILKNYKVDIILLDRKSPIYSRMIHNKRWKKIFSDECSTILIKNNVFSIKKFTIKKTVGKTLKPNA